MALMRASPLDAHMEHAMGALHNVMLTGVGEGCAPWLEPLQQGPGSLGATYTFMCTDA